MFLQTNGLTVCYPTNVAAEKRLTAVSRTQGNNKAVKDGTVRPVGYELDFIDVPVLVQAFRRMVRGNEFDVCEMAATTYLVAKEYGKPFTALPIFLVRGFHHGAIVRSTRHGIEHPKQLEGRAVGVNRGYTVTTGVWARAVLRDEYGVDLDSITWVLSGDEHVAEYRRPANVVPVGNGRTLPEMVDSGELAAAIGIEAGPDIVPLIPDPAAAGLAALKRTGIFPINHLVVVKDELLAAHPDLGPALFDAFAESKRRYLENPDDLHRRVRDVTGSDPLPYGIEPNRHVLQSLIGHALDQHILSTPPVVEELFARGTWDLVG
jgi:4,5-dihydroxyphthalate decarboxylase